MKEWRTKYTDYTCAIVVEAPLVTILVLGGEVVASGGEQQEEKKRTSLMFDIAVLRSGYTLYLSCILYIIIIH